MGKVIFEIGGPVEIRPEVAKEALRLAAAKLPVPTEFVTRESAPRIGNQLVDTTVTATAPATATVDGTTKTATATATSP